MAAPDSPLCGPEGPSDVPMDPFKLAVESAPLNGFVNPLLTDMYQITMAYAYWKNNRHQQQAVFDVYFRKNPFGGEYTIFAGLEECIKHLNAFKFTKEQIDWLRTLPQFLKAEEGFFEYLGSLDCSEVQVYALKEGTVCFPKVPLIRVQGPLGVTQLLETTMLTLVNYPSLVVTNAARFRHAAGSKLLLEFGLRRAQGPDGGISASRYAYMGGFDGTSNVLASQLLGIPCKGTHAHAFVCSFVSMSDLATRMITAADGSEHDLVASVQEVREAQGYGRTNESELAAFCCYAQAFPNAFLALVDTYDTLASGVPNYLCVAWALVKLGYKPMGIRLDSGDLAYLSKECRKIFEDFSAKTGVDFSKNQIVASNDINEPTLLSLRQQGHSIDAFGIGTHLVTCQAQPALGCVYKLVQIDGKPRIKLSQEVGKITIPGVKVAYRLYNSQGLAMVDLMQDAAAKAPEAGTKILCRHPFEETKRAYVTPSKVECLHHLAWDGKFVNSYRPPFRSLESTKERVTVQINKMREDHLRPINPTPYKVSVTAELYDYLHGLWLEESPITELS